MYVLGYDIGSSSVKASLVNVESGKCAASAFFPKTEAPILAVKQGWAEQDPQSWWDNLKLATQAVLTASGAKAEEIKAIGISYQMHGLVCVDKNQQVLRSEGISDIGRSTMLVTPAELTGQLHGFQTGLGKRKRAGGI